MIFIFTCPPAPFPCSLFCLGFVTFLAFSLFSFLIFCVCFHVFCFHLLLSLAADVLTVFLRLVNYPMKCILRITVYVAYLRTFVWKTFCLVFCLGLEGIRFLESSAMLVARVSSECSTTYSVPPPPMTDLEVRPRRTIRGAHTTVPWSSATGY